MSTGSETKKESKAEKNRQIHRAHIQHGHTLKAIADSMGSLDTTLSKVIKTLEEY